jgi:hypothetical protein
MGKMEAKAELKAEAKKEGVPRRDHRHEKRTVSLLRAHSAFSPTLALEKETLPKKHGLPQLTKAKARKIGHITPHTKVFAVTGNVP